MTKQTLKNNNKRRSWKKPKDKPKRPLSAYNFFFQQERERILREALRKNYDGNSEKEQSEQLANALAGGKEQPHRKRHGLISFRTLSQTVSKKWKTLNLEEKEEYKKLAEEDKDRYYQELAKWEKSKEDANIMLKKGSHDIPCSLIDHMAIVDNTLPNPAMDTKSVWMPSGATISALGDLYKTNQDTSMGCNGSLNALEDCEQPSATRLQVLFRDQSGLDDSKPDHASSFSVFKEDNTLWRPSGASISALGDLYQQPDEALSSRSYHENQVSSSVSSWLNHEASWRLQHRNNHLHVDEEIAQEITTTHMAEAIVPPECLNPLYSQTDSDFDQIIQGLLYVKDRKDA